MDETAVAVTTGVAQVFDLHALKAFAPDRRVRTMLFKTEQLWSEIACYEPGQSTPMHHHPTEVGGVVRDMLRAWPGDERIAVLATGGLSHEPGGPRYLYVDEQFDRWFLELLAKGDHATILREATLERMEAAGSGGTAELLAWMVALAFTEGPADVLAYMPAVAWRTGTGMLVWNEMRH